MSADWLERAACRDEDPELFFPVGTSGPALRQADRAKQVCYGCPVIVECLPFALDTPEGGGIWAGTNEAERNKIREMQKRTNVKEKAA